MIMAGMSPRWAMSPPCHAVLGVAGVVADRVDHMADDKERLEGGGEQGEVEAVDDQARRHEENILQEL